MEEVIIKALKENYETMGIVGVLGTIVMAAVMYLSYGNPFKDKDKK